MSNYMTITLAVGPIKSLMEWVQVTATSVIKRVGLRLIIYL